MTDLYQHRILSRTRPTPPAILAQPAFLGYVSPVTGQVLPEGRLTRMTAKGQVTIPKRLRDYLGLKPGSEVEYIVNGDGQVALRTEGIHPKGRFDAIRGTLELGMTTDEFMRFLRGNPDEIWKNSRLWAAL